MKKLLALAGIALIAAACTNNDEPVQECGQINLTLENSTAPEIEVSTRTVTDLTETDAKDYNIQVLQNGNVKLESTNFLTFKNTTFIFPIYACLEHIHNIRQSIQSFHPNVPTLF